MNVTEEFFEYVKSRKEKFKIDKKVYNWLDDDNLESIITDCGNYYIELSYSHAILHDYVFSYIEKYMKKHHNSKYYI